MLLTLLAGAFAVEAHAGHGWGGYGMMGPGYGGYSMMGYGYPSFGYSGYGYRPYSMMWW